MVTTNPFSNLAALSKLGQLNSQKPSSAENEAVAQAAPSSIFSGMQNSPLKMQNSSQTKFQQSGEEDASKSIFDEVTSLLESTANLLNGDNEKKNDKGASSELELIKPILELFANVLGSSSEQEEKKDSKNSKEVKACNNGSGGGSSYSGGSCPDGNCSKPSAGKGSGGSGGDSINGKDLDSIKTEALEYMKESQKDMWKGLEKHAGKGGSKGGGKSSSKAFSKQGPGSGVAEAKFNKNAEGSDGGETQADVEEIKNAIPVRVKDCGKGVLGYTDGSSITLDDQCPDPVATGIHEYCHIAIGAGTNGENSKQEEMACELVAEEYRDENGKGQWEDNAAGVRRWVDACYDLPEKTTSEDVKTILKDHGVL